MYYRSGKICILGAGNVAWNMAQALHNAGYSIGQIFSRTAGSAVPLARSVGGRSVVRFEDIEPGADLYIIALADDVIDYCLSCFDPGNSMVVHTAGSVSLDIFKGRAVNYGVFYPLQTFSKKRLADFSSVPLCIEANNNDNLAFLYSLAGSVTKKVYHTDSRQREVLHLAAVFANNFSNHMYHIAELLISNKGLPFDILHPLIKETSDKASVMSPGDAQTGPAVRNDRRIIEKHLNLLSSYSDEKELYKLITESIRKKYESGRGKDKD